MSLALQLVLAGLLLVVGAAGGWKAHVGVIAQRDLAAAKENFRVGERRQEASAQITKAKDEKINAINARLVVALGELRKRPERRPADTPACQGATGAELSGPDSGFLEGEAARADTLRAELGACYDKYDSLRVVPAK
ncbi:hypothetical protein PMI15_04693 [Polaromonas sp. CF318]|uniref:hypothetical protein n=1 Tax=Polaromonas sp. CF318 TaxID=1144318 RepID=UPI000271452A|nr:hypothetical protein [Polaromonas sp. CF318]EJL77371.1 hypothetical protein PMI15_04693 [Polaromonas sp. CF318]